MGLFNKLLKSLGFEDEGEVEKEIKEPKIKEKKEKVKRADITASYDLNNLEETPKKSEENNDAKEKVDVQENATSSNEVDFEVVKVKTQSDVQEAVTKLKNGGRILLNIENLSASDITRSLDFLTGAVFALSLKMQKIDDKIYLIQ